MIEPSRLINSVDQYQRTHRNAIKLLDIFEESNSKELIRVQQSLKEEVDKFLEISGLKRIECVDLYRHLDFLYRHLANDNKEYCEQDIREIVYNDLPKALSNLILQLSTDNYNHFDKKLKKEVTPLLDEKHYDSAVRKCFIVLTEKLRQTFYIREEKDGENLVNLIFGKEGNERLKLSEKEKQSIRNLISGFYSLYRNKYAHNNIISDLPKARSIVEMANTIILEIDAISKNKI